MPVLISFPISNPLNITGRGKFSNVYLDDGGSMLTLNSDPCGNRPAIDTIFFTFLLTSSFPFSGDELSPADFSRFEMLVRKPTVMIVTLVSGCAARIRRYNFTASSASLLLSIECGYFILTVSLQC